MGGGLINNWIELNALSLSHFRQLFPGIIWASSFTIDSKTNQSRSFL